ncbi:MAG: K(+) transporter TrkH [Arenicellales bacterium IbO2]|nr:MAG: K(+) transporter TrkH [Arenicellales bacterium IbO2]
MRDSPVVKILGILLMLFSVTLLPPLAVSFFAADGAMFPFAAALALNLALGAAFWLPSRNCARELRLSDGFVVVVLFWTVLSAMGAVPLFLSRAPALGIVDALFESMSGLTTTGATILTGIDDLPKSILYYRQQLQWLGGMGIVVLAVAVMPMLGVGGMQLYRAETPGPVKHNKLTPRITETAKGLWYVYLGLTLACAVCYYFAGMSWFDAVGHAFSTIAIGGFSTHDASLAHFDSSAVNITAMIFMLLSGLNFALHFAALRSRSIAAYLRDPEARVYFGVLLVAAALCAGALLHYREYDHAGEAFMHGAVQAVSLATTTGFTTADFSVWPAFLPVMLILAACIGGCAGSTAGGLKVVRVVLLYKQGAREISKLVHPSALVPVKLGGKPVADDVINAVWGFFALYALSFALLLLLMLAAGADQVTAFSAVAACLNNLGPGLGAVAENYASLGDAAKIILTFAMLLGRLELFTLLLLFTPVFWRG